MTATQRAASEDLSHRKIVACRTLQDVRLGIALTQKQVAARLGMDQSEVSRLEHRTDLLVSTLREYIKALGGELRIEAKMPGGIVCITAFDGEEDSVRVKPDPAKGRGRDDQRG